MEGVLGEMNNIRTGVGREQYKPVILFLAARIEERYICQKTQNQLDVALIGQKLAQKWI